MAGIYGVGRREERPCPGILPAGTPGGEDRRRAGTQTRAAMASGRDRDPKAVGVDDGMVEGGADVGQARHRLEEAGHLQRVGAQLVQMPVGRGQHLPAFTFIGRCHDEQVGHTAQEADVEHPGMGGSVGADKAGAVDGQGHVQFLQGDVVDELVIGALQEGRVYRRIGFHAVGRHASRECHCVLFGDADVEIALRETLGKGDERHVEAVSGVHAGELLATKGSFRLKAEIEKIRESERVIVVDAALLPEWDSSSWIDVLVVVDADEEKALDEDKERAKTYEWRVRSRSTGHLKSTVYFRNFSFDVGQPASFEEKDEHPSAVEYLLAALGT